MVKYKKTLQVLSFLLFVLLVLGGCRDSVFEERFYSKEISQNDLVGYWIITKDSTRLLNDVCEYRVHTNRSNHIFILNSNGTCVVRWYDTYETPNLKYLSEKQERLYNTFFYEEFNFDASMLKTREERRTWYYWNPNGKEVISGPFATNNGEYAHDGGGDYLKNCWPRWRLEDGKGSHLTKECDFDGAKFRYRLWFGESNSSGALYRFIGKMTNGLITIWAPIETSHDGDYLKSCDTIRFVKVTEEELDQIVHQEYGMNGKNN